MAKKNFTQKDAESVDIVGTITEGQTTSAPAQKKPMGRPKSDATEKFTARFSKEEWAYLTEYHWQKRISITDIIRGLVQADMKKHPEILEGIDELNT